MTKPKLSVRKRAQAIRDIVGVMADGRRIDRYLRLSDDGTPYTTDAAEYIGDDGPYNTPHAKIPSGQGMTEKEARAWAGAILDALLESSE
jgi:hypothetical protein